MKRTLVLGSLLALFFHSHGAQVRLKELAQVKGIRSNSLVGYGVVVGLDGSGDNNNSFTAQSLNSLLTQMGVALPPGTQIQARNVAAVMVTATLPAFGKPGQRLDVTVSSTGNAKSLKGGLLLMTPLKGPDNQIYALAQGNILIGVPGANGGAIAAFAPNPNHQNTGRIPSGAVVERSVPTPLGEGQDIVLELNVDNFTTTQRIVELINRELAASMAEAIDGRTVRLRVFPSNSENKVSVLAKLEDLTVDLPESTPKIIINARTGSVVMNQQVKVGPCIISHGNLSLTVAGSETTARRRAQTPPKVESVFALNEGANLESIVRALNALGTGPQDLLAILQAMKSAGALYAELEII